MRVLLVFLTLIHSSNLWAQSDWDSAQWDIGVWDQQRPEYTVLPRASEGGVISPDTSVTVVEGSVATFNVTPLDGFQLQSVDSSCGGALNDDAFTTDRIFFNCTVTANFSVIPSYTVTSSAGENGNIDPDGINVVSQGESVVFTLTPDDDFRVANVGGSCGGALVGDRFETKPVEADCSVAAYFEPVPVNYFPVVVTSNLGGAIDPESPLQVAESEDTTFTVLPDENYEVKSVEGDCVASFEDGLITTTAIFSACEIQVVFGLIPGTVPPQAPILSVDDITSNSALLSLEPQFSGSDPVDSYELACEIEASAKPLNGINSKATMIGDISTESREAGLTQAKQFRAGMYEFNVNPRLASKSQDDVVGFPVSGGEVMNLQIADSYVTELGNTFLQGGDNDHYFHIMLTLGGKMLGHYFDGSSVFEIRPSGTGHVIAVGAEGAVSHLHDAPINTISPIIYKRSVTPEEPQYKGYIREDLSVVSVLVLVDQTIEDEGLGAAVADYYVKVANTAFLKSGVDVALTVAGIETYSPNAETFSTALNDIICGKSTCTSTDAPNPTVAELRDFYQADLVVQMLWQGIEQFCGVARLTTDLSSQSIKNKFSFSVNAVGSADLSRLCSSDVVAHEIGHNMGLLHDVAQHQNDGLQPIITGGRGYRLPNDPYSRGSVMAYGRSVYRFSSPDITVSGVPLGTTSGEFPADAVSALNYVRDRFSTIYDDANDELIPETPKILGVTQKGRDIEVAFEPVTAPLGTPVTGSTSGLRVIAYAAKCGDKTEVSPLSPIRLRGFETDQTYSCELLSLTPYAVSEATPSTSIFMEPLELNVLATSSRGGQISPSGRLSITERSRLEFTLTPNADAEIVGVSGSCEGTLINNVFTTSPLEESCSVKALFEPLPRYIVAPSSSAGGFISPSTKQTVLEGGSISFSLTPDQGFFLESVSGTCGGTLQNDTFTVSGVTSNCTVNASYQTIPIETYPITLTVVGAGNVTPDSIQDVAEGQQFELVAAPEPGWRLSGVSGSCGGGLTDTVFQSAPIFSGCEVVVTFEQIKWFVSISTGDHGAANPSGELMIKDGESLSISFAPDDGYTLGKLENSCGGQLVGFQLTTEPITNSCSISANFEELPPITYEISGTVSGSGYLSPELPVSVVESSSFSFRVSALEDHRLAQITGCGGQLIDDVYQITSVSSDCTIEASFERYRWASSGLERRREIENLPEATTFFCTASAGNAAGKSIDESALRFTTLSGMDLDADDDGISDAEDNCPNVANADQSDLDADSLGDVCDPDDDNDGVPDSDDAFPLDPNENTDTDLDGVGDNEDPDNDGDGFTDLEELVAGTDPFDPVSIPEEAVGGLPIWLYFIAAQNNNSGNEAARPEQK